MNTQADKRTEQRLAAGLARHPSVAAAKVIWGDRLVAYLVPDEHHAPVVHRACGLAASGSLGRLSLHEPAGELLMAQLNRTETDFMYREVFVQNAYLRHGIGIPADAMVVDVGANIGMFSLLAAQRGTGTRVIAVEPVPELAHAVSVNAYLHDVDIMVLSCGLGDHAGEVAFCYYPNNTLMSGIYGNAGDDRDVLRAYLATAPNVMLGAQLERLVDDRMNVELRRCRLTTLTEVVAAHGIDRIDLLKIDAEKAEADVLAGIDQPTWAKVDQVVLEVHDLQGRLRTIAEQLTASGFDVTHDQDQRLKLTPCHTMYARRPGAREPAPTLTARRPQTMAALSSNLREFALRQLAGLPVPDEFVWLASIDGIESRETCLATPQGRGLAALSAAWTELFGAGSNTPEADFFDLGGDSLTAVRLLARIEAQLGEEIIEPDLIFTASRFGALAAAIGAAVRFREQSAGESVSG